MNQQHPFINPYFIDEHGEKIRPEPDVYAKIAELLGEPKAAGVLPPVKVAKEGEAVAFTLPKNSTKSWQLTLESGQVLTGKCKKNQLALPADLPRLPPTQF